MWSNSHRCQYYAHRVILYLLLFISTLLLVVGCESRIPAEHSAGNNEEIVYETDSAEWHVCIIAKHLIYEQAVQVTLQEPWQLPTREDAQVLRTITYPNDERFVTSDGHTFGMPSASVSKAGAKTKYSVLGLWKRAKTIEVPF